MEATIRATSNYKRNKHLHNAFTSRGVNTQWINWGRVKNHTIKKPAHQEKL